MESKVIFLDRIRYSYNKLLMCLLVLLCGCSTGNVIDSSKNVNEQVTVAPSTIPEASKILKEESWQTVTASNEIELQFMQFDYVFIMEVNTKDLSEVNTLDEFDGVDKLRVQYDLTSKKYGNLRVYDVTDQEKPLYGCVVKNNEITEINVYSLDVTKDSNRLQGVSNELFSILQDVIVYNEN